MHTATATFPVRHPRLRRLIAAISLCLALTIATTVVLEQVDVATVDAVNVQCIAGLLGTGFTFIGMALAPPVGAVVRIFAAGSVITDIIGINSCQTGYFKQVLRNYYAAHGMSTALIVRSYACSAGMRCTVVYSGGVGSGGGGGGSGPW